MKPVFIMFKSTNFYSTFNVKSSGMELPLLQHAHQSLQQQLLPQYPSSSSSSMVMDVQVFRLEISAIQ